MFIFKAEPVNDPIIIPLTEKENTIFSDKENRSDTLNGTQIYLKYWTLLGIPPYIVLYKFFRCKWIRWKSKYTNELRDSYQNWPFNNITTRRSAYLAHFFNSAWYKWYIFPHDFLSNHFKILLIGHNSCLNLSSIHKSWKSH